MPIVLSIQALVKQYPGLRALDDVSLEIEEGEIFGLLGPNGAGKTTLIGAVCGLVRRTSGKISLFGIDIDVDPITPRYSVGLVPQEVNFDAFFTVREALQIQLGYYGKRPDPARIDEVLAALSLTSKADARTRALSGGMKRRLLIAKALVHRPKLLFLDEPTAGVDVELRQDLWKYVRKLRSQGMTVVLTTHYLEEAEALTDRVVIIDGGKLLLQEKTQSLLKRQGERRLFVRLAEPLAQLPQELRMATQGQGGRTIEYVERGDAGPNIAELLRRVYAAGLRVEEVATAAPRLEDIMLAVLGHDRSGLAHGFGNATRAEATSQGAP